MTDDMALRHFPYTVPLFDLEGIMLLPGAHLPAHIIEPKYLKLLGDVMAAERYVGFVQPKAAGENAPLFNIGCLGKITTFVDKEDGSFFIIVTGIVRFQVDTVAIDPKGYRFAAVSYDRFLVDLQDDIHGIKDRDHLLHLLELYFKDHHIQTQWDEISRASDNSLLSLLTMIGPFEPIEKQAILETYTLEDRARMIQAFMEMATLSTTSKIERSH